MSPEFLGLSRVDFITVGAVGPPGRRTFYLQAAQGDLLVSLIIEKEHAAALSIGIYRLLEQLGYVPRVRPPADLELRQPLEPLFRVGSLGLGYDPQENALVLVARVRDEEGPEVRLWCSQAQMYTLSKRASEVVAAGQPRCPLCNEPLEPGQHHICARDNGHKWLFHLDE